jgi:hypothetical protein
VNLVEVVLGERQMAVIVGEPGVDASDMAGQPFPVSERDEQILAAVAQ